MKLVTIDRYGPLGELFMGIIIGEEIVIPRDADVISPERFVWRNSNAVRAKALNQAVEDHCNAKKRERMYRFPLGSVKILAPIPKPAGIRDFIAFEQHIRTLRNKRGQEVPEVWYRMPLHYRGDHLTVYGPEDEISWPRYCRERFDFELELACVIGKEGVNISVEEAHEYIAGYMIMNDWSCRDIQKEEMQGGLGPSMAKPGASFGPYLVTEDELPNLANLKESPNEGPLMRAYVNGEQWTEGRFGTIHWSFAEMIAHISQDRMIYPGEILGSGTVGGGCGAELDRWIQPGDVVELEIEGLGRLRNRVGFPKPDTKEEKNV